MYCIFYLWLLYHSFVTGQRSKVQAIYKIARPNEEESLRSLGIANHKLLWHGSSVSNFISILHRGLLMSPPEVPMTGNLFGDVSTSVPYNIYHTFTKIYTFSQITCLEKLGYHGAQYEF